MLEVSPAQFKALIPPGAVGALGFVVGGVLWHFFAKPILTIRDHRLKAIRCAERYAYIGLVDADTLELARTARTALIDAASDLRMHAEGQPWPVHLYVNVLGYNLEEAALALRGLAQMTGESYPEERRTNNSIHVLKCLRARLRSFTPEELASYSEAIETHPKRQECSSAPKAAARRRRWLRKAADR
jgi:hypothetical protein